MKLFFAFLSILSLSIFPFFGCTEKPAQPQEIGVANQKVKPAFLRNLDSLSLSLLHLDSLLRSNSPSSAAIQTAFFDARDRYKHIEFLAEYYAPSTSEEMNGPALQSVGEEYKIEQPTGFQVLEELLFPLPNLEEKDAIFRQTTILKALCNRLKSLIGSKPLTDDRVFDALRLEVARIVTLSITGFDSPLAFHSLSESASALESIQQTISLYPKSDGFARLDSLILAAQKFLTSGVSFEEFDRLVFIQNYANPISHQLLSYQNSLKIPFLQVHRVFRSSSSTLFENDALSSLPFSPDYTSAFNDHRVELGKALFFDPVLSNTNNRSCASCHQPVKAFTDGISRAKTLNGNTTRLRNTPTVLYSGFQSSSSYDQKTIFLEDRVMYVVHSPDEMNSSLQAVAQKLSQSEMYPSLFAKSFEGDSSITPERISKSIAQYMRSLGKFNSRFDQYLRGDSTAMNIEEKRGFNLFAGKAKCATCHFIPLFNGTVPPTFTETEAEVIGVPKEAKWKIAEIDPDEGKMTTNGAELNRYMFKTPTLRNVALTAPYMHNGVYKTLDEVMRFYNVGGGAGIGIELPNQTLPGDSLKLTDSEIKAVIAFMKTLNDSSDFLPPNRLPSLSAKMLRDRKPLLK